MNWWEENSRAVNFWKKPPEKAILNVSDIKFQFKYPYVLWLIVDLGSPAWWADFCPQGRDPALSSLWLG